MFILLPLYCWIFHFVIVIRRRILIRIYVFLLINMPIEKEY